MSEQDEIKEAIEAMGWVRTSEDFPARTTDRAIVGPFLLKVWQCKGNPAHWRVSPLESGTDVAFGEAPDAHQGRICAQEAAVVALRLLGELAEFHVKTRPVAEDAPPDLPPKLGGERPVALEDGSRLLFCSGAAAEVRPFLFKGERRRGVLGLGRPDELALLAWAMDAEGNVARLKLEPHEARALAAELVKRAEVVERERAL